MSAPGRAPVTFQTVVEGEIVGVSWLLPPYRWSYDARAVDLVRAIAMDAKCLRDKCDSDHDLGYEMMMRFVPRAGQPPAGDAHADPRRLRDAGVKPMSAIHAADPMVPDVARVVRTRRELADVWTLEIDPGPNGFAFAPGQFNMLYAFGVGEAAISVSGDPAEPDRLIHTIRAVGNVSTALAHLKPGDTLGVRGPFGHGWPVEAATDADVVIVAGGLGLAPLRPTIYRLIAERSRYGRIAVLSGARSPTEMLFRSELERWSARLDIDVEVTVDHASRRLARQRRRGDDADRPRRLRPGPHGRVRVRAGDHDAHRRGRAGAGRRCRRADLPVDGAQHEMRHRPLRPLPVRGRLRLPGRAGRHPRPPRPAARPEGDLTDMAAAKPKLAVWKFASCDGCQLTLLDCEDEFLDIAGAVDIAYFVEATRATVKGPYDVSLVEGSITTAHDAERIREVRRQSKTLITIGACATAGGIQALRNFADVKAFTSIVYAHPDYISTLATSTPIAAHVPVDFELRGCPIDKRQLIEVISAFLAKRKPVTPHHSVCVECKLKDNVCVMVAHGTPCLGPVTHAGCGALCPSYDRGCYGCFGPMETPNAPSLSDWLARLGMDERDIKRVYSHLQRQRRSLPRGSRTPWRVRPSRSTTSPASRARARSPSSSATAR